MIVKRGNFVHRQYFEDLYEVAFDMADAIRKAMLESMYDGATEGLCLAIFEDKKAKFDELVKEYKEHVARKVII